METGKGRKYLPKIGVTAQCMQAIPYIIKLPAFDRK
jgi:hypothetical protein